MTGLSTLLNLPLVLHSVVPCVVAFPTSFVPLAFSVRFLRWVLLSRNCYVRTRVNIIEPMYERSRVSLKVKPCSTFTFTHYTLYIASFLYTQVKFTCVLT